MDYEMEDLFPIVAKLADKYTSKESSSVPYTIAQRLMEAVIYCINEYDANDENAQLLEGDRLQCGKAYEKGYECVIEKVYKSKAIYECLIEHFEEYECLNYKDTITKGIPAFFTRYDAKFNPQNHMLTLDYPTMFMNFDKCGVDLILEYLTGIEIEKRFLDLFPRQTVIQLLMRILPDYKSIYLDNICSPVLLNAVGCVIADRPVFTLEINEQDCRNIRFYFDGDTMEQVELKITNIIRFITDRMNDHQAQGYFVQMSKEYAVRVWYALENDSLDGVFHAVAPPIVQ